MFMQKSTPSQTGSKPSFSATGTKIGAVRSRMPIQSMKQPRTIQISLDHQDHADRLDRQPGHRVLDELRAAGERVDADQRRRAEEQPVQHHGDLGGVLRSRPSPRASRSGGSRASRPARRPRRRRPPRSAWRCRDRASRAPKRPPAPAARARPACASFSRERHRALLGAAPAARAPARSGVRAMM